MTIIELEYKDTEESEHGLLRKFMSRQPTNKKRDRPHTSRT